MSDKPTNKPEVQAEAKPEVQAEAKPEVKKPSAFDALVSAEVVEAKKSGTSGRTQSSANSRAILAKLRDKGRTVKGMTVEELRYALQLSKTPQQTRKAIRTAQEAACEAGDLVFCRNTSQSQNPKGEVVELSTEVSRYFVVPAELVETASAESLAALRTTATDWVYKGDIKTETRPRLAEVARMAYA